MNKQRPAALTVLPILTFITSAILLMVLFFMGSKNFLTTLWESASQMGMDDTVLQTIQELAEVPSWIFYFFAGCLLLTITGAILMMKMEKIGFHLFIISKLLLFGCGVISGYGIFSLNSLYFPGSILFALLYFNQLKNMESSKENGEEQP